MKVNPFILSIAGTFLVASTFATAAESPAKPPKKHHLTFNDADADHNGGLTVFEFATLQGPGTPLVQVRKRFLAIDVSGAFEIVIDPNTGEQALDPITGEPVFGAAIPDGLISLDELTAYRALEDKPESDLGRFDLADFDGDGQLSPVEFGYLVSPRVPFKNVMRKFDKRDTNDDGFLSKEEFKKSKSADL
ncbi:MAG: hypothetical protein ABI162_12970 [Luteolibacter sp.]